MRIKIFLILLFLGAHNAFAETDVIKLLDEIENLYRMESSHAEITMRIETPHWQRSLEMVSWSRGVEDTFVRIISPKKDRGVATLRKDKEMWNYFPKINKVIKVPPSMMMGSWMGSDFTNDDLVKQTKLSEEYTITLAQDDKHYTLTLIPKAQTVVVWGKITIKADIKTKLPVEYVYYNEKGEKARVMKFSDIKTFDGLKMPARLEVIPLKKKNHKTIVIYDKLQFNVSNPDAIFTLRNLKKR